MTRRIYPHPTRRNSAVYRALWNIVDGAVRDALKNHPEYLSGTVKERTVRESIDKRVVGALEGFIHESAKSRHVE